MAYKVHMKFLWWCINFPHLSLSPFSSHIKTNDTMCACVHTYVYLAITFLFNSSGSSSHVFQEGMKERKEGKGKKEEELLVPLRIELRTFCVWSKRDNLYTMEPPFLFLYFLFFIFCSLFLLFLSCYLSLLSWHCYSILFLCLPSLQLLLSSICFYFLRFLVVESPLPFCFCLCQSIPHACTEAILG